MRAEISYDLVMTENMDFVEGAYRLGGRDWQVFIMSRRPVEKPEARFTSWDSGVTGMVFQIPEEYRLNQATVETLMSEVAGVNEWSVVRGPDSMDLR
jgi:hypothetical protein